MEMCGILAVGAVAVSAGAVAASAGAVAVSAGAALSPLATTQIFVE